MFDLENTALEIKTTAEPGSAGTGSVVLALKTADDEGAGYLSISYSSASVLIRIEYCDFEIPLSNVPKGVGEDNERVWRVTLDRTYGIDKTELTFHCNDEFIYQYEFDSGCSETDGSIKVPWNRHPVVKIHFGEFDMISQEFRPYIPRM